MDEFSSNFGSAYSYLGMTLPNIPLNNVGEVLDVLQTKASDGTSLSLEQIAQQVPKYVIDNKVLKPGDTYNYISVNDSGSLTLYNSPIKLTTNDLLPTPNIATYSISF
jgi:hypothetical protein